jgi:hypothetical protein
VRQPTGGVFDMVRKLATPPPPQSILFAYNVQQGGN